MEGWLIFMMELSKRIEKILEDYDFSVCGEISKRNDEEYDIELETYSPEGEDVIVPFTYDGTEDGFIKEFRSYAEDFDAEEHAEMWIESRGKNGVPESIKDLLDDAEWIKSTLEKVADELEGVNNEETEELKMYKCTISITDGEQIEEQDFYVEAETFEKAVEKIKSNLDI